MEPDAETGRRTPACAGKASARAAAVEDGQPEAVNRSSVWSPLLHAVWKPDPKGRDQVRISLTRSYRSPTLAQPDRAAEHQHALSGARRRTRRRSPTAPATRRCKPELATGIDIAVERYLPGSGLLSANVFQRQISDYMRSVTTLETRVVRRACRATCRGRRTSATR